MYFHPSDSVGVVEEGMSGLIASMYIYMIEKCNYVDGFFFAPVCGFHI